MIRLHGRSRATFPLALEEHLVVIRRSRSATPTARRRGGSMHLKCAERRALGL
jgi:hypothetical protein